MRMPPADLEEIRAAARRYFGTGLGCAVETQDDGPWEARVLALPSADAEAVLAAVLETQATYGDARIRLAAYSPSSLTRLELPAPVACWSPSSRASRSAPTLLGAPRRHVALAGGDDRALHEDVPLAGKGSGSSTPAAVGQALEEVADVGQVVERWPDGSFAGRRSRAGR